MMTLALAALICAPEEPWMDPIELDLPMEYYYSLSPSEYDGTGPSSEYDGGQNTDNEGF